MFKTIISIKKVGKIKTYDISVNKIHNFILSNMLLSHNCMFKTTAWRDKVDMCDELRRERRMTTMQIADLAFLDRGQCFLAETGRNVRKVQIVLPRSMFWKKEHGNFYKNLWDKHGGEWTYTNEAEDYINEKCRRKSAAEVINKLIQRNDEPSNPNSAVIDTTTPDFKNSFNSLIKSDEKNEFNEVKIRDSNIITENDILAIQPFNKDAMKEEIAIQPFNKDAMKEEIAIQNKDLKPKKPIKTRPVIDWDALGI